MRVFILLAAAAASLSACGPYSRPSSAGDVIASAEVDLAKFETHYRQVKDFLDVLEPYLPATRVAQIQAIEAKIDAALGKVHKATTVAERAAALLDAQAQAKKLDAVSVDPADGAATPPASP